MELMKNSFGERLDVSLHEATRSNFLVVLGHGVTGNKDRPLLVELANQLSEHGWPTLRVSFSGNGASEGNFTDSCITKEVKDLSSVIEEVGQGRRIAYIGHSMGGAVGVLTAARDERIKLLVSLAGMVNTADFVKREFGDVTPGMGCMWDDPDCPLSQAYVDDLAQIGNTLAAAEELSLPCLLLHGKADDIIPSSDSRDLLKVLSSSSELVEIEGAEHSFEGYYDQVSTAVCDFLEKHFNG